MIIGSYFIIIYLLKLVESFHCVHVDTAATDAKKSIRIDNSITITLWLRVIIVIRRPTSVIPSSFAGIMIFAYLKKIQYIDQINLDYLFL